MRYVAYSRQHIALFSAETSQRIGDAVIEHMKTEGRPRVCYVYDSLNPPKNYYRYTVYVLNTEGGIVAATGHQFASIDEVAAFYKARGQYADSPQTT